MSEPIMIQRAPSSSTCCDAAGRMCLLAWVAIPLERLVRVAVFKGEGTELEIRARIRDMLSCGMLIEL
jgi:hypothetical protein